MTRLDYMNCSSGRTQLDGLDKRLGVATPNVPPKTENSRPNTGIKLPFNYLHCFYYYCCYHFYYYSSFHSYYFYYSYSSYYSFYSYYYYYSDDSHYYDSSCSSYFLYSSSTDL